MTYIESLEELIQQIFWLIDTDIPSDKRKGKTFMSYFYFIDILALQNTKNGLNFAFSRTRKLLASGFHF